MFGEIALMTQKSKLHRQSMCENRSRGVFEAGVTLVGSLFTLEGDIRFSNFQIFTTNYSSVRNVSIRITRD